MAAKGLQTGEDGRCRCAWGAVPEIYRTYHDGGTLGLKASGGPGLQTELVEFDLVPLEHYVHDFKLPEHGGFRLRIHTDDAGSGNPVSVDFSLQTNDGVKHGYGAQRTIERLGCPWLAAASIGRYGAA